MAIQKIQPSFKFNVEQLQMLKYIAPEAFKDNILDFNTLYEALADTLEEDEFDKEQFGLIWPGKKAAKKMLTTKPNSSLIPVSDKGVNAENTKNILIEGENLEVLKLILKSYAGKGKVVYLDPPYNTGNDFIYDDNFTESLEEYLRRTGQIDDAGRRLTTNSKADGRYHSKWLSMMYPRLKMAFNLLRDDGLIFISIDDNEVHNLRHLMNEIFGEENFIGEIITIANPGGRDYLQIAQQHEYVIVYGKTEDSQILELSKEGAGLNLEDEDGPYQLRELRNRNPRFNKGNRPNLYYPFYINSKIKDKYGCCAVSITPREGYTIETVPLNSKGDFSVWRWGIPLSTKNIIEDNPDNSQIVARQKRTGGWNIYEKNRRDTTKVKSVWDETEMRTEDGTRRIRELFGYTAFDHPKSVSLLRKILDLSVDENDLVIDFFGGSGTTGEAVYEWVASNKKDLNFLLIQAAEQIDASKESYKKGYSHISEVTADRLKLAIQDLKPNFGGFKFYKLWYSNFKQWRNYSGTDIKQLETLFSAHESNLIDDWTPDNLLTEVLLLEGFPLDSIIENVLSFTRNKVQKITSDYCEHALFVCLDKKVEYETIKGLSLGDNDVFICLDNAVTDQDKARLDDKGLIKTI
jgi:adenine-specific DNA-methyltransferase